MIDSTKKNIFFQKAVQLKSEFKIVFQKGIYGKIYLKNTLVLVLGIIFN